MKTFACIVVATLLALPAAAEQNTPETGEIDATFTWSGVDLARMPAADDGTSVLVEVHLVLTSNVGGPVDRLAGTCLMLGTSRGQDWQARGSCALADAEGDMLFEEVVDVGDQGRSVITGGTGKFAGFRGEHSYTTTWYASIAEGRNQGVGHKRGTWSRAGM